MPTTQPSLNRIKAVNPPLEGNALTYLTNDYAVGVTSLNISEKTGFFKADHNNDTYFYILIGNYGQEKSEIVRVTADDTTNSTLTIAATLYSHEAPEPITYIPYNQVKLFGSTTSGAIVYTDTALVTVDIDVNKQYTNLYYEGSTYTYFKIGYYNEDNTELSPLSEEITSASFTRRSAKRIIESGIIKALTKIDESENSELNWDKALTILQDGVDEIITRKRKWPSLHKIDSTSIDTVVSQAYIEKPSDLSVLEFIIINNTKMEYISRLKYDQYTQDGTIHTTSDPVYYTNKNNKIYLYPTPNSVKDVTFEYFSTIAEITELSTEVNLEFVTILIYYCAAQFAYIRGNDKRGDKMYTMYSKLLEQQVEEYTGPNQSGDAESVETTNYLNED